MPGPQFNQSDSRFDPYKNFRFRIKWDNRYVAGVTKVNFPPHTSQIIKPSLGSASSASSAPQSLPAQADYRPIEVGQGVTHDTDFDTWARQGSAYSDAGKVDDGSNKIVPLNDLRKDIIIELYNEAGQNVMAYNLYRCWVTEYKALSELDGLANAVTIQSMTLANEGWERDPSATEPIDPSSVPPQTTP